MNQQVLQQEGDMIDKHGLDYDERLSTLEAEVKHVNASVEGLSRTISTLVTEVRKELKEVRAGNQLTWPLIFTAVGTLISILTIAGALFYQSLQPLYLTIESNDRISVLQKNHNKELLSLMNETTQEKLAKDISNLSDSDIKFENLIKDISHDSSQALALASVQDEKISNLEELLEKHMSLHGHPLVLLDIARLESKISAIESNRFTNERGGILEGKVQALETGEKNGQ